MVVPFGFFVAASIAVYAVRQKRNASKNTLQLPENDEADWTSLLFQNQEKEEKTEKEEKETVKNILTQFHEEEEEEEEEGNGFPEFGQLFTREIDFPLPQDEYVIMLNSKYETDMAIAKAELNHLRNMVKELEDREVKLEGELLEYYGLKDQESDILELQKEMKVKLDEINTLNITIKTLESERTKLHDEMLSGVSAKKELEATRILLKETQRQIQVEDGQTKGQLLMLKKQIADLLQVLDQIRIFVFTLLHFLGIHSTTTSLDVPQPTAEDYVPYMMAVSSPASIKKSLPVVQFSLFRKRLPMGHAQQEPVCAVCLCGLQDKHEVRMLGNCFHGFHKACIDKWVDLGQVTCPLCRSRLLPRCSRLVDYPIPSSVY